MKEKHLKKRLKYFQAISGLRKKDLKNYIKDCPNTLIHVISEACFNLCHHDKFNNDKKLHMKIKPLHIYIEKLADENVHVQFKREILQKIGAEVVSLINSNILPLLQKML